ncbi:carbohydrate ABC transporter permease [Actinomyces sp.]|uniref:carbohydrate ABC transporter permease n=1 Tax=Actinomyces sp. TaxID=29317 RepID=UPI0026DD2537|nr:carbohydrate ABC transporter permease [Actinomyces sp.]MDO4900380.1 carbohydrate ABC transporter permease [Actinomyces sp.]
MSGRQQPGARGRARRHSEQEVAHTRKSPLLTAAMWLVALVYGFPVLWFLLSSFKPGGELFSFPLSFLPRQWTLAGYTQAWTRFEFATYFKNTLIVASTTTVLTVIVSAATGYALAKYSNRWLKVLFIALLMTTMLPTEVILSPTFLVIRDLGLYNRISGLVMPSIMTATGVFMFRQFFLTVPNELLEAARLDGAGEFSTFFRIMLPLSRPIVLTLAIFSFQWRWNDYIWPLIVISDKNKFTLQVALRSIVGAENINWTVLLGASIISILPLLVIYLIFQRNIMGADLSTGIKD